MTKRYYYISPDDYSKAKENDISKQTLEVRVREHGWDVERAISTPVRKMKNDYKAWMPIAKENDISYRTLRTRVSRGMSIEKAATTPLSTRKSTLEKMHKKRRTTFTEEQLQTAYSNGISHGLLHTRYHTLKWTKEKAVSTPPMSNAESLQIAQQSRNAFKDMHKAHWQERKAKQHAKSS